MSLVFFLMTAAFAQPNDPLFSLQWGLENTGQSFVRYIDEANQEELNGTRGFDLGWSDIASKLPKLMKRDVVVAVFDYGIDWEHPEFKDVILLNDVECDNGKIPLGEAKEDRDGNGYKGDCMGWNFATTNPTLQNRPRDDHGHGTHISSLIAAVSNNNEGLSGLAPKIKILPLKLLVSRDEQVDATEANTGFKGLEANLIKAIHYAISRKADVFNFSMGWPQMVDSPALRSAFQDAIKQGIFIVAASGNNGHNLPIAPCSYPQVFCVGAYGPDGWPTSFTNFGAFVDGLAPGERILGAYPLVMHPANFASDGYEFLSGTSQAAPYVSGVAAILKSIYPQISSDEIWGRLVVSQTPKASVPTLSDLFPLIKDKTFAGEIIRLDRAINEQATVVVLPVFKDLYLVTANKNNEIRFDLPIHNFWLQANGVVVRLKSKNPNIQFLNANWNLGSLKSGEVKTLKVKATANSPWVDSLWNFEVEVSNGTLTKSIAHQARIGQEPRAAQFQTVLANTVEDIDITKINVIRDFTGVTARPDYYLASTVESGLQLTLLNLENEQYHQRRQVFPGMKSLFFIARGDFNRDAQLDYLLMMTDESQERLFVAYLDKSLKPLWPTQENIWELQYEAGVLVPSVRDMALTYINIKGLGEVAVPVFYDVGRIPELDQDPQDLEFENMDAVVPRVYYYLPTLAENKFVVRLRQFDNVEFQKKIRAQLRSKFRMKLLDVHDVAISQLWSQSPGQAQNGELQLTLTAGSSVVDSRFFVLKLAGEEIVQRHWQIEELSSHDFILQRFEARGVFDLTQPNPSRSDGVMLTGQNQNTDSRSLFYNSSGKWLGFQGISWPIKIDYILGVLQGFMGSDSLMTIVESRAHLIVTQSSLNGEVKKQWVNPIYRSTFVPGLMFSENNRAICVRDGSSYKPALFIDSSGLIGNFAYMMRMHNNEFYAPIRNSWSLPENCYASAASDTNRGCVFELPLVCKTKRGVEFKFLSLQ